jgi:Xaa-Pro aminopeptidase
MCEGLLNLRGNDVQYNPVFWSYVLIAPDKVFLYVDEEKCTDAVKKSLGDEVVIKPYKNFVNDLKQLKLKDEEVHGVYMYLILENLDR